MLQTLSAVIRMLLTTLLAALFIVPTTCLQLNSLVVPAKQVAGESVVLKCLFDVQQDNRFSVSWYRDNKEFYRYVPNAEPRITVFKQSGIDVDVTASTDRKVVLRPVTLDSSGTFKCEVTVDFPTSHSVTRSAPMLVVDLPDGAPSITGGRTKYHVGDDLFVNCTSLRSSPVASLTWFINGEAVLPDLLTSYPPQRGYDRLETAVLGLSFTVRATHFVAGKLRLKCTAAIDPLYSQSSEKTVEDDSPQTTPLVESKPVIAEKSSSGSTGIIKTVSAPPLLIFPLALPLLLRPGGCCWW